MPVILSTDWRELEFPCCVRVNENRFYFYPDDDLSMTVRLDDNDLPQRYPNDSLY